MIKSKRLAAGLLAVLTAFSVAGCGDSEGSGGSTSTESKSDAAERILIVEIRKLNINII